MQKRIFLKEPNQFHLIVYIILKLFNKLKEQSSDCNFVNIQLFLYVQNLNLSIKRV